MHVIWHDGVSMGDCLCMFPGTLALAKKRQSEGHEVALAWTNLKPVPLKADTAPYPSSEVLLGNQTVIGQTIAYPSGTPMLNAIIVPLAPGGQSAWHTHQAPVFGFVLEGELTVDYGSKGVRVFRAGEALLEAIDWPHQASNRGTVSTRVLAVNMGTEGGAFAAPAAGPQ